MFGNICVDYVIWLRFFKRPRAHTHTASAHKTHWRIEEHRSNTQRSMMWFSFQFTWKHPRPTDWPNHVWKCIHWKRIHKSLVHHLLNQFAHGFATSIKTIDFIVYWNEPFKWSSFFVRKCTSTCTIASILFLLFSQIKYSELNG